MAKQDARGWEFQILDPDDPDGATEGPYPGMWVEIGGINEFELDPSSDEEIEETTDFQSRGNWEGEKMQTGESLELTGSFRYDEESTTPGTRDRGQAVCERYHKKVSTGSHATIRMRHESEDTWAVWRRSVCSLGGKGGGNNAKTSFSATFQRSGTPAEMDVAA